MNNRLPKSDLDKLKEDVFAHPPAAALPSNLPDHWLDMIARDLEKTLSEGSHNYAAAPLAIVIRILEGKNPGQPGTEMQIPLDKLFQYFCDLRIEINFEIINRKMGRKIEPATMDAIFTNRDINIERPEASTSGCGHLPGWPT